MVGRFAPYTNCLALSVNWRDGMLTANIQRASNREFIITKDFFDEESDLHNSNTAMEAFDSDPNMTKMTFDHAYLGDFFRTEDRRISCG